MAHNGRGYICASHEPDPTEVDRVLKGDGRVVGWRATPIAQCKRPGKGAARVHADVEAGGVSVGVLTVGRSVTMR
jgi:hypothetical protein